ncbi:hypothetical protein H2198_004602 [Neophaeococcomyces mojaviensis]|uniref:Uncharacterized protein n=1 Tax=Neophaeococcomyces mojaviensis TaxID=3383035 RepID=A0ACC3A820_9EURO|nr:hypothetical protein H2198_004602 [Knufia sp. JES_112]
MYLWEYIGFGDDVLRELIKGNSSDPVDVIYSPSYNITFTGIAVHCDIATASGHAQLNPMHRTFSSFQRFAALSNVARNIIYLLTWNTFKAGQIADLSTPQVLAASLVNGNQVINDTSLASSDTTTSNDQVWAALHNAIGSAPMEPTFGAQAWGKSGSGWAWYRGLRPKDLQLAMYKLLGESVIVLMDEGGTDVWEGKLHLLKSTTYLAEGVLSWICVLVLLSLWALVLCFGALWTAFLAGPRWAPTLDGYEMLKFGAQHADEVNSFEKDKFQGSTQALQRIPGMVGILPGMGRASSNGNKLGFIGLSENVASKDIAYTMNRSEAATNRI